MRHLHSCRTDRIRILERCILLCAPDYILSRALVIKALSQLSKTNFLLMVLRQKGIYAVCIIYICHGRVWLTMTPFLRRRRAGGCGALGGSETRVAFATFDWEHGFLRACTLHGFVCTSQTERTANHHRAVDYTQQNRTQLSYLTHERVSCAHSVIFCLYKNQTTTVKWLSKW